MKEDAKILYPNIEIREVETITGDKRLAFIGSNADDLMAFHCLRFEERIINREIEQAKMLLHEKIVSSKQNCNLFIPSPQNLSQKKRTNSLYTTF